MNSILKPLAIAVLAGASSLALGQSTASRSAQNIALQDTFDHIDAQVHRLSHAGRDIYYIDEGTQRDRPVVFISGQGTSLEAFQLTEFARSSRQALGLRVIAVERNGFGASTFDPKLGYADYSKEVLAVLDHLGIDKFVVMAISGGGAYAAHLATAAPQRVISLHLGAAVSATVPGGSKPSYCGMDLQQMRQASTKYTHHPMDWWTVFRSPTQAVPGWQARAFTDATRAFYLSGQLGSPDALAHENLLPCAPDSSADLSHLKAPAFLYYGEKDEVVKPEQMQQWKKALPNVRKATLYPGEGHATQYRHWVQILADMAGYDNYTVVCRDGKTKLIANDAVRKDERLDLCAWPKDDDANTNSGKRTATESQR